MSKDYQYRGLCERDNIKKKSVEKTDTSIYLKKKKKGKKYQYQNMSEEEKQKQKEHMK